MPARQEFEKLCFEARLRCINTSIEKSFEVINPDRQPAQWLKEGVNKYGGTDHPDPTFW